MTLELLLQEFEQFTYTQRMYRMVELGRMIDDDASIAETIRQLAQGSTYQRLLALQSCYGSRDTAMPLQALADSSYSMRSLALNLVILNCSDTETQIALDSVSLDMKKAMIRHLYRQHRQTPINMYIEMLVIHQDAILKTLLAFGSQEVVTRHLARVQEQFELADWRRLARLHPSLAVASLSAQTHATDIVDQEHLRRVNVVLPILSRFFPELALSLVQAVQPGIPLVRLNVQKLAQKRPNEFVEMLLQTDVQNPIRFDNVIQRLTTDHLLALFTRFPGATSLRHFSKLTPQQRLALYNVCERGWRTSEGVLAYEVVAALPTAQRIQEGRRNMALPVLATRPMERLRYAAFLPWEEARAMLDSTLRSPDADLRGATLHALVAATRYQRDHLPDALALIRARRNEQDPVRREMLTALADLPLGIWQNQHLNDLTQIIRDALDASDLSTAAALAIERIVMHLLPFHPAWSATQIPLVYRERGRGNIPHLDTFLSDADTRRIAPVLVPVFQAWQAREQEIQLVAIAQAFGRRLRVFDELVDTLEPLLFQTRLFGVADTILRLFSTHRPERLITLVPALLASDKSCITIQPVYTYLHRHRQDLLTPFLGRYAYEGRFSTGKTRSVLPLSNGFQRWTPTQQAIFAEALLEVANDPHRPTHTLLYTLHQLAAMPFLTPAHIISFASDARQPVRDVALRLLGRLDAGQGIPTLLEALNDERAHVAIYSLRNSLLAMPQTEALRILRNIPLRQVTVAKEVVRLVGDLASDAAYRELLALNEQNLHRDVRVALLRALWSFLDHNETWDTLMLASQSSDVALARGVVYIPSDGMTLHVQQRLAALLAQLLIHPEPEVRLDTLQRCTTYPVTDADHVLLAPLLQAMASPLPKECSSAANAVFVTYTGNDAPLIGNAIRGLLTNRRALQIVIEQFLSTLLSDRRRQLPTTRAILATLATDPLTVSLRIRIILHGLPWEEVTQELVQLREVLHADALGRAESAIQYLASRPDANLFDLETALATNNDERLRRLALAALIAQTQQASGWSDERIARLQVYRDDVSPLVAEAAQFTFVS